MSNQELASFIWTIADLLRGDFRQNEYGDVYNDTWVEKYDDYQKLANIALGSDAKSAFLMGHIMKEVFNSFRQANVEGI